VYVPNIMKVGR